MVKPIFSVKGGVLRQGLKEELEIDLSDSPEELVDKASPGVGGWMRLWTFVAPV